MSAAEPQPNQKLVNHQIQSLLISSHHKGFLITGYILVNHMNNAGVPELGPRGRA